MTPQVLDKLKSVSARYEQLMRLVSDATVQADPPTYRTHTKALAEIQPLVDKFREHEQLEAQLADALLLHDLAVQTRGQRELARIG